MSQYLNNSDAYTLITEKELAVLLSSFNSQYIFDITKDKLQDKYNSSFNLTKPNAVESFEQTFKNLLVQYPMDRENILDTREEVYREMTNIILNEYGFVLRDDINLNSYTLALYVYDFFVANFAKYISLFFANYLYQEKNSIYSYFRLEERKKDKDSSTIYGKKTYANDVVLGVISANIVYILDNIISFDITFEHILRYVYKDDTIVNYLLNYISPTRDFYKEFYCEAFRNKDIRPMYITHTSLEFGKLQ